MGAESAELQPVSPLLSKQLVYYAFVCLGIVCLFPYNCFLSSTNFFDQVAFPGRQWPLYSTQVYQTVFLVVQFLLVFSRVSLGPRLQLLLPLVVCSVACVLLILVALCFQGSDGGFIACLLVTALLGSSMGVLQSSAFAVAAQGIQHFGSLPGAQILGMGAAGIVSFVLAVSVQAITSSASTAFVVLFVAVTLLSLMSTVAYGLFKQIARLASSAREPELVERLEGLEASVQEQTEEWSTCRSVRAGLVFELAVFCVFAVTFTVFPATVSKWKGSGPISADTYITVVMGTFQVMDTLGRWLADNVRCLQALGHPAVMWVLVLSRGVFIPIFFLCAYSSNRAFGSQWIQLSLMALFACSNGMMASIVTQFAPKHVPIPAQGTIGRAMTFWLVSGIAAGSYLAMLT